MSTANTLAQAPHDNRVVLDCVSWETYEALVDSGENFRGRMTYVCGVLEIMSPGKMHENIGRLLGRLIEVFTEERKIDVVSVKSMTYKRKDLKRGFEGDEAYYIQSSEQVRHKSELNAMLDPPPDLVIEIDITQSSIDKLEIFGPLQVPEVWRYSGEKIQIYLLDGQSYRNSSESRVLPGFPIARAEQILDQRAQISETTLVRSFRAAL